MADIELRNESGLEFTDISSEEYRIYCTKSGLEIIIENPQWLNVSNSGGHRVLDGEGISHYIAGGSWDYLGWKTKEGEPHFVK